MAWWDRFVNAAEDVYEYVTPPIVQDAVDLVVDAAGNVYDSYGNYLYNQNRTWDGVRPTVLPEPRPTIGPAPAPGMYYPNLVNTMSANARSYQDVVNEQGYAGLAGGGAQYGGGIYGTPGVRYTPQNDSQAAEEMIRNNINQNYQTMAGNYNNQNLTPSGYASSAPPVDPRSQVAYAQAYQNYADRYAAENFDPYQNTPFGNPLVNNNAMLVPNQVRPQLKATPGTVAPYQPAPYVPPGTKY